MFVHYFTVPTAQSMAVETIYKEFGENIPIYLQCEYKDGIGYAFCVDICKDVIEICKKHNCPIDCPLFEIEIDEKIYNNSYKVCQYKHNIGGAHFYLKKIKTLV